MNYDRVLIEDTVLALLVAFSFDGGRAWKGFDFEVMDEPCAKGLIDNPKGRAKSVWITPKGVERGRECAQRLFGSPS